MNIEEFRNIRIAYMRRTGEYGPRNKMLMEQFKTYLKENQLLSPQSVILGIALDNPALTDSCRYDVGLVLSEGQKTALNTRSIPDGMYAVFEVPHTEQDVAAFWKDLGQRIGHLPVDETKPVIERYSARKIAEHLCEFCVPLRSPAAQRERTEDSL